MSTPDLSDLFARAKARVSIVDLAGRVTTLKKFGREQRGACPICGAGSGKGARPGGKARTGTPPFKVDAGRQSFYCFVCEAHGDVVALQAALDDSGQAAAARKLLDGDLASATSRPPPAAAAKSAAEGPSAADRIAAAMRAEGRPIEGTLVWRYLINRGIPEAVVAAAAPRLRFKPLAKWWFDEAAGAWVTAPAMVADIVTAGPDGQPVPTGGVHATYLTREARKAGGDAKRMWGPQRSADGRIGGAWLIGAPEPGPPMALSEDLVVAEGIETALSLVGLCGGFAGPGGPVVRAAAALNLGRLQGGIAKDAEGCADVFDPKPDPDKPPFLWPPPVERPWRRVLVGVDRDMAAVKIKGRAGRGKPMWFQLGGEARARLCARLATGWWAGTGVEARALAPPPGADFNDVTMEMAG